MRKQVSGACLRELFFGERSHARPEEASLVAHQPWEFPLPSRGLRTYYRRNGFWATIRRAGLAAKRALFSSRSVLFYCDLATQIAPPADLPSFLKVERKKSSAELSPEDLQAMTSFWNPKLAHRNMKERFDLGASLWLIKSDDKLAGYGWTLQGQYRRAPLLSLGAG